MHRKMQSSLNVVDEGGCIPTDGIGRISEIYCQRQLKALNGSRSTLCAYRTETLIDIGVRIARPLGEGM